MGKKCDGSLGTRSLRKGNRKAPFPSAFSGPNSTPLGAHEQVKVLPRSAEGTGEEARHGQAAQAGGKGNVIFHAIPSKGVLETKKRKKENKAMHLDWNLGPEVPLDRGKGAY